MEFADLPVGKSSYDERHGRIGRGVKMEIWQRVRLWTIQRAVASSSGRAIQENVLHSHFVHSANLVGQVRWSGLCEFEKVCS